MGLVSKGEDDVKMFKYLTGILDKEGQKSWKLLVFLSLMNPATDILSYSMVIYIINLVIRDGQATKSTVLFTFLMGGVSVLKLFLESYKCKLSSRFAYDSVHKLSMKIYEVLIKEDLENHNQKSAVQALTITRSDTMNCVSIITDCIEICTNFIIMGGYIAVMICASKWAGILISLFLMVCMVEVYHLFRARMKTYGEKCRACAIKTNSQVTVAYGVYKELKMDDRSVHIQKKYEDASRSYAQIQGEFRYKSYGIGMVMQNSMLTLMFAILGLFLCIGENLTAVMGAMIMYVTAFARMIPLVYGIIRGLSNVEFSRRSYEVLKECFDRYDKIKEEEKKDENLRRKKPTFHKGLFVRDLTFGYNDKMKIFENASIDIPAGHSVAVIGMSGAGKTTFLDLILGLLKPEKGTISYDDYDIVSHTDKEGACKVNIGEIVSYIPQTVYLNGETIRNNVAFFDDADTIDDEKVKGSLVCAQIWEEIVKMPEGINTLIGENGTLISGGQRQRIALARALYKDFEILIMDEATGALDMETEKAVIDSIRQVKKDKTILLVTHHMNLAEECDMIYRIENRKMVRMK